jgi:adenylate cyclase
MDYTIIGGSVNLASRPEAAATPGEILMSYETYANVRDRIRCEERGHITARP